ncbi:MAG: ABC transporter permease [Oscillospiraceae bacterium]|jgi:ABC-2 type transport system permease protein|nr:ABC transporter permease [Oscillospiraceae bacterium]
MFFKELYDYRFLLREIAAKNIKIQYRNSVLGVLWTFVQPLLTTLVLVIIFGKIFGRDDPDLVNYPIYLLSGRLLYEFYSKATKRAMRSVTLSASVINKVKVPKYAYPIASVLSEFVTGLISLLVLVGFMVFYIVANDHPPHITKYAFLSFVPLVILFFLCIGVGLILSTLAVFFKDVEYLYDVFTMLLFYATPIFYAPKALGTGARITRLLEFNPLYSVVDMFRDCVLRGQLMDGGEVLYASLFALGTVVLGGLLFKSQQDKFILYL